MTTPNIAHVQMQNGMNLVFPTNATVPFGSSEASEESGDAMDVDNDVPLPNGGDPDEVDSHFVLLLALDPNAKLTDLSDEFKQAMHTHHPLCDISDDSLSQHTPGDVPMYCFYDGQLSVGWNADCESVNHINSIVSLRYIYEQSAPNARHLAIAKKRVESSIKYQNRMKVCSSDSELQHEMQRLLATESVWSDKSRDGKSKWKDKNAFHVQLAKGLLSVSVSFVPFQLIMLW